MAKSFGENIAVDIEPRVLTKKSNDADIPSKTKMSLIEKRFIYSSEPPGKSCLMKPF